MGSSLPCPSPTVSTLLVPQGPGQNPSLPHPLLPSLSNSQETRAPVIRAGQCPGRYIPAFLEALRGSLGRRASEDRAPHSGAGSHAGQGSTQWLESLHGGLGDLPGGAPLGAATVELTGRSLRRPPNRGSSGGRRSEVGAPSHDRRASSLRVPSPRPTNCCYFLLQAVSSNKLRLITRPPA